MKLRQQLVLLSLLTLVLPWAGLQYIGEMDRVLRAGQIDALQTVAQAAARYLSAQEGLAANLADPSGDLAGAYVHPLPALPVVDGYFDDWLALPYQPQALEPTAGLTLHLARHGDYFLAFIQVDDASRQFFNPSRSLALSDHLRLSAFASQDHANGGAMHFAVATAAPGKVQVFAAAGERMPVQRVQGVWQERSDGYQLELRLPRNWVKAGLRLSVHDGASQSTVATSGKLALFTPQPELAEALALFADKQTQLRVINRRAFLLAESGRLGETAAGLPSRWQQWLGRLLRWFNTYEAYPRYAGVLGDGRLRLGGELSADSRDSGAGTSLVPVATIAEPPSRQWLRHNRALVARVVQPLDQHDKSHQPPSAFLVAERSSRAMHGLLDTATGSLLLYSVMASALAGLALVVYASWLSLRLRRLQTAGLRAVDSSGKISGHFPASRSGDEIGDLSRAFAQLLRRLQAYTQYLEGLAAKLSHELRTPLAVIRSSLDNLQAQDPAPQSRVYTERAQEGVQRLSHILNAMSSASRMEQSLQSAEKHNLDLVPLFEELCLAYRDLYHPQQLSFACSQAELRVHGNAELIVQMMDKLLENAADFCQPQGSISLALARDRDEALLRVENTGPPLPEDLHQQIFDSMVSSRRDGEQSQHLGLGLFVVRMIVDFHRGQVKAFNRPEKGTVVFEVRLACVN